MFRQTRVKTHHHRKAMEHNSNIRVISNRRVQRPTNRQHKAMVNLVRYPKVVVEPLGK